MRNILTSSLKGKEAGNLNVFRCRCLAQRATLLTCRSEHQLTLAPAFKQPVQAPHPHQNLGPRLAHLQHTPADHKVQRPPPRPCQHCNGSHWDADCTKVAKPLTRFNPAIATHHIDAAKYINAEYKDREYRYLEANHAGHQGDLSVNDVPGMTYSPDASGEDSFGST
ncbi:hypothetical protein NDA18_000166 [Ustilago nuda]|nr:hypothetical protein NDA18_000166 [Ustilago nuda]